jgi:hypothetical protein
VSREAPGVNGRRDDRCGGSGSTASVERELVEVQIRQLGGDEIRIIADIQLGLTLGLDSYRRDGP